MGFDSREYLIVSGYTISGITNDSGLTNESLYYIPTEYAVKKYVDENSSQGSSSLSGLTDVSLVSLDEGELLQYTGGTWKNVSYDLQKVLDSGTSATLGVGSPVQIVGYNRTIQFINTDGGDKFTTVNLGSVEQVYLSQSNNTLNTVSSIYVNVDETYMSFTTGSTLSKISITKNTMLVKDDINNSGLVYDDDYSSNYTDRSLVDKAYVDSVAGGGTPGGIETSIQFNSGGTLSGVSNLTYNLTTLSTPNLISNGYVRIGTTTDNTQGNIRLNTQTIPIPEIYYGVQWRKMTKDDPFITLSIESSTSATTWNYQDSCNAIITLTQNVTTFSIQNNYNGASGYFIVKQDGVGGRTMSLPSGSKVVNGGNGVVVLTSDPNSIDILTWKYDGTNIFWSVGYNAN